MAGGSLAIGDDVVGLRDRDRPMLALYYGGMGAKGTNFYNDVLRRYGYEKEAEQIQDLYLGGNRKEAAALVPDELIAGMSLVGDAGYVKDRVAAYRDSGVTVLNVQPVGPERAEGHRDDRRLDVTVTPLRWSPPLPRRASPRRGRRNRCRGRCC